MVPVLLLATSLAAGPPITDLSWLAGCWSAGSTTECWLPPAGGVLVGVGHTVRAGEPASFEHLVVQETPAGLVYTASPKGQAATSFLLVERGPRSVVFENPDHDFPQRIRYARTGDTLVATVSGAAAEGDPPRVVTWTLTRDPTWPTAPPDAAR